MLDMTKVDMLDWDWLKLFYEVAKAGAITAAAEKLDLSQPALSRSIKSLEDRLNIKLFDRFKYGVALTHEGEILYRHVHNMYNEEKYAEHIRAEGLNTVSGGLTVCTTPAIASSWLMRFIPSFLEKYPDIELKVICQSESQHNQLADVHIKPFVPMQPTLVQHFLMKFTMRLYASQKYINMHGLPKDEEDLDNHRLISFGVGLNYQREGDNWSLKVGHRTSSMRVPYMVFSSADYLLRAAEEGMGIVELGKGFPQNMGANLVEVLPDLEGPKAKIYFIYPEHRKGQPKIAAFLEHIVSSCATATASETKECYGGLNLNRVG